MSETQPLEIPGYQVVQFLGSGARSAIWQVRDPNTGDFFVLKRVIKRYLSDDRFLKQAENEYEVGSKLSHPSIRKVLEIRRFKRWFSVREIHILMEMCDGKNLQENRPANIADIVRIFCDVASGLAHMNSRGYVHADMKPNNIIVSPAGIVKIIDLGQSCRIGTMKDRVQGTPDFIAPEQVHRMPLDSRTDVFNFGAALYWTLTSRAIPTILPQKNQVGLIKDLAVVPPEQFNPQVPSVVSRLVTDCIEMVPSHRPASMNEVSSRLTLIVKNMGRPAANGKPVPRGV